MSEEKQTPSHAVQIARMWARVPAEHLEIALKALEPELLREHEHRLEVLRQEHEHRLEVLRQAQETCRQNQVRYLSGLWAGFIIALGMLAGAVVVGVNGQPWLATVLAGPSLIALAKVFVLRRSDASDVRQLQTPSLGLSRGVM